MLKNLCLALGIMALLAGPLFAQNPDPHHLKLFEAGEQAFIDGNYREAAKKLELALFGMNDELAFEAKAFAYLGISHYYLNNLEESEEAIRAATQLLDQIGFEQAKLHSTALVDLEKLQVMFKLKDAEESEPVTEYAALTLADLKKELKNSRNNIDLYYELHERYRKSRNPRDAEKILEELVKHNPDEIDGYMSLGIYEYTIRKYDDCIEDLGKLFDLSRTTAVSPLTLNTARAYQILAADRDKDKDKTVELVQASAGMFSPETVRMLRLQPHEKIKLLELIAEYQEKL